VRGVVGVERATLDLEKSVVVASGEVDDLQVAVAVGLPQRDHADVLDESGEERLVGVASPVPLRYLARGGARADRAAPEALEVEADLVVSRAVDRLREREAERERLQRVKAEEDERLLDRSAAAREAEEARVDRAQHLRGESGVVLDHARDLADGDLLLRGELEHAHSHAWKRGAIGVRENAFDRGLGHDLTPSSPVRGSERTRPAGRAVGVIDAIPDPVQRLGAMRLSRGKGIADTFG